MSRVRGAVVRICVLLIATASVAGAAPRVRAQHSAAVAPFPGHPPFFRVAGGDGTVAPFHLTSLLQSLLLGMRRQDPTARLVALTIRWAHAPRFRGVHGALRPRSWHFGPLHSGPQRSGPAHHVSWRLTGHPFHPYLHWPPRRESRLDVRIAPARFGREVTVRADFYAPATRIYARYEIRQDAFVARETRLHAPPPSLPPDALQRLDGSFYGLPSILVALRREGFGAPPDAATLILRPRRNTFTPIRWARAPGQTVVLAWRIKNAAGRLAYVPAVLDAVW